MFLAVVGAGTFLALPALSLAQSCSLGSKAAAAVSDAKSMDIVETAVAAGSFNTLTKALTAAGMVSELKKPGPFTVFAPTDKAFDALPAGTVEALLADVPKLRKVLLYHVVSGKVMAADVVKLDSAKTLQGQSVSIQTKGGVKIEGANVVKADIAASNGVIHVIDKVILPKDDIVDVAVAAGSFKTLVTAIKAAGLEDVLRSEGPFTVFAPTDAAFAKLPAGALDGLLKDKDQLRAVLTYHVISGKVLAADVVKLDSAKTVQGQKLEIHAGDKVTVDNANVVKTDILAGNGVIHVIDAVLLPASQ